MTKFKVELKVFVDFVIKLILSVDSVIVEKQWTVIEICGNRLNQ